MSTQSEDSKPEPEKSERPPGKIHYCEICQVPCTSSLMLQIHFSGIKHKKRERALTTKCAPVIQEEEKYEKKPLSENITCLKDYMKDPNRDEPLVGLEYVVEIRFQGRKHPCYKCQLCQFNTEMVPMIDHLTGQRHRKMYLVKHFPDKVKRKPNDGQEIKPRFLKRIAREVEKEEGLKMYKCDDKPSTSSSATKKKARWPGCSYKPKNDPVLRQKALEYMDFFEITSDSEATQVIRIAQSLSEALKAFCEKKAALKHVKSLPSLLAPVPRNTMQQKPNKPYENYRDDPGNKKWTQEYMSNGFAQLQGLLGQAPSSSHTHLMGERTSSYTISSNDLATVSALRKSLASQPASSAWGLNEWMTQFSQSASVYFQSNPAREKTVSFTSSQSSYATRYHQGSTTQKHENRMADTGVRNWDSMRESYSATRKYPANCPSQGFPSWYNYGKSNQMPISLPAETNSPGWPQSSRNQQSNPQADRELFQPPFSSGSPYSDYQQQNIQLNNMMSQSPAGLSSNIMSQLRGKDPATLARMLQELVPHYPDLQKIDIYALAHALSKIN